MKTERKQLYDAIVANNLQEAVKKEFGRNYTQVGNDQLKKVIEANKNKVSSSPLKEDKPVEEIKSTDKSKQSKVDKLIKVLTDKRILLKSEIEFINKE